jgi:hypothetical protein
VPEDLTPTFFSAGIEELRQESVLRTLTLPHRGSAGDRSQFDAQGVTTRRLEPYFRALVNITSMSIDVLLSEKETSCLSGTCRQVGEEAYLSFTRSEMVEFERALIQERVRAGLRNARATSRNRSKALPCLLMCPSRRRSPLDSSDGTRPT